MLSIIKKKDYLLDKGNSASDKLLYHRRIHDLKNEGGTGKHNSAFNRF